MRKMAILSFFRNLFRFLKSISIVVATTLSPYTLTDPEQFEHQLLEAKLEKSNASYSNTATQIIVLGRYQQPASAGRVLCEEK